MAVKTGMDRLEKINLMLEQITPWPWGIEKSSCGRYTNIVQDRGKSNRGRVATMWGDRRELLNNAEFFASAPREIRWLCKTLRLAVLALKEAADREQMTLKELNRITEEYLLESGPFESVNDLISILEADADDVDDVCPICEMEECEPDCEAYEDGY